ncbi:hypothetical protein [Methylobacterium sp. Leaf112]|uniref:hypothetical protein n=1 Tax=Methylobacterium sp. Leaf112 TaxID=1736258 RepID=UPI003FCC6CA8
MRSPGSISARAGAFAKSMIKINIARDVMPIPADGCRSQRGSPLLEGEGQGVAPPPEPVRFNDRGRRPKLTMGCSPPARPCRPRRARPARP